MQKIKLIGQLLDDPIPTTLAISNDIVEIGIIAEEYQKEFPEIFLSAEWGYFKQEVGKEKKEAILNLLSLLFSPVSNIFNNLNQH